MKTRLQACRAVAFAAFAGLALAAAAHEFKLGAITIDHPYARATAPGQPSGAAYLRLNNGGASDDRLLSAEAGIAAQAELHTMTLDGDVMRMRQLDAVALPAGKSVEFKPGAMHLMLMGLKAPLKAGGEFPLTLRFEKAGSVTVTVKVEAAAARPVMQP